MAQAAPGIAEIIAGLSATDWGFSAFTTTVLVDQVLLSGTWSQSSNTITWGGTDPSLQNTSGSSKDVSDLVVRYGTVSGSVVCHIPHTPVTLADQETIVYTSIQVTFTTDDFTPV